MPIHSTQKKSEERQDRKNRDTEVNYSLSQEQMLELVLRKQEVLDENWVEIMIPNLVEKMLQNYEKYDSLNHLEGKDLPSKDVVIDVLEHFLALLFPGYHGKRQSIISNPSSFLNHTLTLIIDKLVGEIDKSLKYICRKIETCPEDFCINRAEVVVKELLEQLPEIRVYLKGDMQAAFDGDPAARSIEEVILSYPCVLAIATYRIAHELYLRGIPMIPRIMSEYAHSKTGIDINPGAKIGKNFFIDHGTGVVIGETAEIGDNVKLYQGVTLGALSFTKDEKGRISKGGKRHPTIGNKVVIYAGATILGGKTIIEDAAVIGGNVWITTSIPSDTQVTIIPPKLRYKNINNHNKHSEQMKKIQDLPEK
jgi:serine O-acetyltransferase